MLRFFYDREKLIPGGNTHELIKAYARQIKHYHEEKLPGSGNIQSSTRDITSPIHSATHSGSTSFISESKTPTSTSAFLEADVRIEALTPSSFISFTDILVQEEKKRPCDHCCGNTLRILILALNFLSTFCDVTNMAYGLNESKGEKIADFLPIAKDKNFYPEAITILLFYWLSDLATTMPWAKRGAEELLKFFAESKVDPSESAYVRCFTTFTSLFNLYAAFADGIGTYFFFASLDDKFKNIAGIPLGIVSSLSAFSSEGVNAIHIIKTYSLRELLLGRASDFQTTTSRYLTPALCTIVAIPGAFSDYCFSYITMMSVFPYLQSGSLNTLFQALSASNSYGDIIFVRKLSMDALDRCIKKVADILNGNYPTLSEVAITSLGTFCSYLIVDIQRQVTLAVLNDPDVQLPIKLPNPLIQILAWTTAIRYLLINSYYMIQLVDDMFSSIYNWCAPKPSPAVQTNYGTALLVDDEEAPPATTKVILPPPHVIMNAARADMPASVPSLAANGQTPHTLFKPIAIPDWNDIAPRESRCTRIMRSVGCTLM